MIRTGNIYLADLPYNGHIQGGKRPVIVTQNNSGNKHSPIVHVVPLTSRIYKRNHMPTHVLIRPTKDNGLAKSSIAIAENVHPIDKSCLLEHIGQVDAEDYSRVANAVRLHLAV